MNVISDLCLLRLAGTVAKRVREGSMRSYLQGYHEEVYSEALVAATVAAQAFPGQVNEISWTPLVEKRTTEQLIRGLKTQRYLPTRGGLWSRWITNVEGWMEELADEN